MKDVILVVEGGGSPRLDVALRQAIDRFAGEAKTKVRNARGHWETIPARGRDQAFDKFSTKMTENPAALVLLLIDSEDPTDTPEWSSGIWARRARDGRLFFMVRCMEAWIVADPEGLDRSHLGLKKGLLPKGPPEECSPEDLRRALEAATKDCGFGPYGKRHDPLLLASVDPKVVVGRCPSAKAFLDGLNALLG